MSELKPACPNCRSLSTSFLGDVGKKNWSCDDCLCTWDQSRSAAQITPQAGEADYIGWARYVHKHERPTVMKLCDSDTLGAFKIYRTAPPQAGEAPTQINGVDLHELRKAVNEYGYKPTNATIVYMIDALLTAPPCPVAPVWRPPAALLMRIQSWRSGRQGALEEHEIYSLAVDMAEAILSALPPDSPGAEEL